MAIEWSLPGSIQLSLMTPGAILACLTTGLVIRWILGRNENLPPGPTPMPFVGNTLQFNGKTLSEKCMEWKATHGDVFTIYLGRQPFVVINSLEALTEAYIKRGSDFANKPQLLSLDLVSAGYNDVAFAQYGDRLVHRRKIFLQSLRHYLTGDQNTKRVHHVVQTVVENILEEGRSNKSGHVGLAKHLYFAIFSVIHTMCFGYTMKMDSPVVAELMAFFQRSSGISGSLWEDYFPFLRHCWPSKQFKDLLKDVDYFQNYIQKHIDKQRAMVTTKEPDTLIEHLLQAQEKCQAAEDEHVRDCLSDVAVRQIIANAFFAGTDTSRQTLEWLFLILSENVDVQARLHKEIDSVVGKAVPGREHRSGLVYTESVIRETMRLYPVVPMGLPHETMRDTKLQGYDIPAKVGIFAHLFAVHRDPKLWENPDKFIPERFIDQDGGGLKQMTRQHGFVPFNIGPRNCVGEFLAKQNLLYSVTGLLQRLQFRLPDGARADYSPAENWQSFSAKPYSVLVSPREHKSSK